MRGANWMESVHVERSSVPQNRIRAKVDEYMSRRDYPGVERLLLYWLDEAEKVHDVRGKLMILSELVGHYRKTGEKDKGAGRIEEALALTESEGYTRSVSGAITYINAGTAYNAFEENEKALPLFEKAREILLSCKETDAKLLAGLHNNMGLTYLELAGYEKAASAFLTSISLLKEVPDGKLEQAVSFLNLADAYSRALGMPQAEEKIFPLLDSAERLFMDPDIPRNGYYAYVSSQSAPTFDYYGYFFTAEQLRQQAKEIYERTGNGEKVF